MAYDPALVNTAACRSTITFIDGDKGILRYRGYPIDQLAEQSSFLETAWLVIEGELPTASQLKAFTTAIHDNRVPPARMAGLFDGLAEDPHPMGALIASFGALGTFYPESHNISDPAVRRRQVHRIIAQAPALAAYAARARKGQPSMPPAGGAELRGQLPVHAAGAFRGRPSRPTGARARARHPVHPARGSRAELLHLRDAQRGQLEYRIRIRRWRRPRPRCTARCTAGRTRRCCACCTASGRSTRCRPSSRASRPATAG